MSSQNKDNPIDKVHPTVKYIGDVCKKASEEGYTLNLSGMGFVWKNKSGEQFGEQWMGVNAGVLVLQACIFLEKKEKWSIVLGEIGPDGLCSTT